MNRRKNIYIKQNETKQIHKKIQRQKPHKQSNTEMLTSQATLHHMYSKKPKRTQKISEERAQ